MQRMIWACYSAQKDRKIIKSKGKLIEWRKYTLSWEKIRVLTVKGESEMDMISLVSQCYIHLKKYCM